MLADLKGASIEVWQHRELLEQLTKRDIKLRYKQTAVGAAWVILQPLLQAAVFTVVFGKFGHLPANGIPYWAPFTWPAVASWEAKSAWVLMESRSSAV